MSTFWTFIFGITFTAFTIYWTLRTVRRIAVYHQQISTIFAFISSESTVSVNVLVVVRRVHGETVGFEEKPQNRYHVRVNPAVRTARAHYDRSRECQWSTSLHLTMVGTSSLSSDRLSGGGRLTRDTLRLVMISASALTSLSDASEINLRNRVCALSNCYIFFGTFLSSTAIALQNFKSIDRINGGRKIRFTP